ncbi:Rz1-like lysis system protein LysC [Rosenbergiella nectarea]|uniref:Rz1-like lysis system protein LysC n=1 Tax=Rosenbergiella nectarea TaxID=988801 RepID=UPI003BAAFC19
MPESLTRNCLIPEPTTPFTWQSSLLWNETLLTSLENCNIQMSSIRKIELIRRRNEVKND